MGTGLWMDPQHAQRMLPGFWRHNTQDDALAPVDLLTFDACGRYIEEGWGEGKGRRGCLGGRINSIPCRASYFALGRFIESDDQHQDDLKNWMNSKFN